MGNWGGGRHTPDTARELHVLSNTVPPQTLSAARLVGPLLQARQKKQRRNSLCSTVCPSLLCSGLCSPPALLPGPSWCWGLPSSYTATSAHTAKWSCSGCADADTVSEASEQISASSGWEMGISPKDCPCFKSEAAVPRGKPLLQLHPKEKAPSKAVFQLKHLIRSPVLVISSTFFNSSENNHIPLLYQDCTRRKSSHGEMQSRGPTWFMNNKFPNKKYYFKNSHHSNIASGYSTPHQEGRGHFLPSSQIKHDTRFIGSMSFLLSR